MTQRTARSESTKLVESEEMWAPSRRTDSNYFHAAELPAKGLLGSELGYRTGDTDAFSFPLGVGGSGERFAALPW